MTVNTSDNRYGTAQLIVAPTIAEGANYTTITAALAAAVSGQTIFVRPGTYTENLTLKAGVNITTFTGDSSQDLRATVFNVKIIGKMTATFAGNCSVSNICLQTNSDFVFVASGASAINVDFISCFINVTNNNAVSVTAASSNINFINCSGNLETTGITYFVATAGNISLFRGEFANGGGSSTASTFSNASFQVVYTQFSCIASTTNASTISFKHVFIGAGNNIALTLAGTSTLAAQFCEFASGSASALSIGAGCVATVGLIITNTSNAAAITGAGTINYSMVSNIGTSSTINTTTQAALYSNIGKYKAAGQPAFLAYLASADVNVTGNGTLYTLGTNVALTEVFDQDSNFNTNGTFTAPVTGRYYLSGAFGIQGCTIANQAQILLTTSNRTYTSVIPRAASAAVFYIDINALCDMDAADTAVLQIIVSGESGATDDLIGAAALHCYFSGYLAC